MTVQTFRCERHAGGLTLTPAGCARLYQRAKVEARDPSCRLWECRGCAVGASHAGEPAPAPAPSRACPRCGARAARLIRARAGWPVCVSCYNREREVLRGRNARGGRPRLVLATVAVWASAGAVMVRAVTGVVEVAMALGYAQIRRAACQPPGLDPDLLGGLRGPGRRRRSDAGRPRRRDGGLGGALVAPPVQLALLGQPGGSAP